MNIFNHLRQQMRVVANPRYREPVGGFYFNFVGVGKRKLEFEGWWPTEMNFYVIDAADIAQRVRIPEKKREIMREPDHVLLYAPGVLYEEACSGFVEFNDAWIVFGSAGKRNPLDSLVRRDGYCLFRDEAGLVRHYLQEAALISDSDAGLRWIAMAAFLRIVALLNHSLPSAEKDTRVIHPIANPRPHRNEFQERVLRILRENLSGQVSVAELARQLSLSRSALTHRFSSEMGETLSSLRNRLRVERAQEWIRTTEKPLKEIAFELGFDDPAYFSRVFQRTVGFSPAEYRRLVDSAGQRKHIKTSKVRDGGVKSDRESV